MLYATKSRINTPVVKNHTPASTIHLEPTRLQPAIHPTLISRTIPPLILRKSAPLPNITSRTMYITINTMHSSPTNIPAFLPPIPLSKSSSPLNPPPPHTTNKPSIRPPRRPSPPTTNPRTQRHMEPTKAKPRHKHAQNRAGNKVPAVMVELEVARGGYVEGGAEGEEGEDEEVGWW